MQTGILIFQLRSGEWTLSVWTNRGVAGVKA